MMAKLHLTDLDAEGPFFSPTSSRLYNFLHQLPQLLVPAAIALYASDLRRYDLVGTQPTPPVRSELFLIPPSTWSYDKSLPLDIVTVVVLGHCVIWHFLWTMLLSRSKKVTLIFMGLVDFVLWAACLGLGDTTLALRSSTKNCTQYDGGCQSTSRGVMIAAGSLMIVLSIAYQLAWIMVLHTYWRKHRRTDQHQGSDTDDLNHPGGAESATGALSPAE